MIQNTALFVDIWSAQAVGHSGLVKSPGIASAEAHLESSSRRANPLVAE